MTLISKLKDLARAATSGPWRCNDTHELYDGPCVDTERGEYVCTTATDGTGLGLADAAYIASVSPDRILQLLAVVENMRGELEYLKSGQDRQMPGWKSTWVYQSASKALAALKAWEES